MITLGIDIGSSSIKVSLFDAEKGQRVGTASWPPKEMEIISPQKEWAEQDPELWMENLLQAMGLLRQKHNGLLKNVAAIGITYQMHGLVLVNRHGIPLRPAIIWCDSRAVNIGHKAFNDLGNQFCLSHLLNSPGNFTASKLKWVKDNEPSIFDNVYKFMLPGDYIAFRLTDEIATTASGLSEGVFWDFEKNAISQELLDYFGFAPEMIPQLVDTFSVQGKLSATMAAVLGMTAGTPVSYRAGDQPNNAFSLGVLNPGEVAATAGTSGVVYGITNQKAFDEKSRVNTFLHVNHQQNDPRLGVLLCLNSVGILNSWSRHELLGGSFDYPQMNERATQIAPGSDGLLVLPFGNGAERVLENKNIGASFHGLNLTRHHQGHVLRAIQEGIAFAFKYGLEIMEPMGLNLSVIRAGQANMFLSNVFTQTLSQISGARIELYNTDGSEGAARGAAIGAGYFAQTQDAFQGLRVLETIEQPNHENLQEAYENWKKELETKLLTHNI